MARVSIIVPTRNRAKLLPKALESILAQTYTDWECIVIDDISEDKTLGIIKQFAERDKRIQYIHLDKHHHIAKARNIGIRASQSPLIAYLDDDDIYYRDFLSEMISHFDKNPQCQFAYCKVMPLVVEYDKNYNIIKQTRREMIINKPFVKEHLYEINYISIISVIHTRELIEQVGNYDKNLYTHDDWDMFLRMAKVADFDYIPQFLVEYRWHKDSISNINKEEKEKVRGYILDKNKIDSANRLQRYPPDIEREK